MVFSSPIFLFAFLPLTLLIFYTVRQRVGHTPSIYVLILASAIFYGWWNVKLLPLIMLSVGINFLIAGRLNTEQRTNLLIVGLVFNLGLLAIFKYTDFFIQTLNVSSGLNIPLTHIPLPLAISFFTFQQIAFLVDTYRRETQPSHPAHYTLFVSFFPQLIAGPIVNHKVMAAQISNPHRQTDISANLAIGLSIFTFGLAKKLLLADNFAPFASSSFDLAAAGETLSFWQAWTGALCYSFQIFFDFSGYSDMAMGLAKMFGFQIPINFNAPYKAKSVTEFWRRWHITLSHFLRDYLYIPLGGNRISLSRTYVNLLIVMLLGGLWHGAAWTFVVWGGLHGLALMWCRWREGLSGQTNGPYFAPIHIVTTFLFVTFAWVFFRADGFPAALSMLKAMSGLNGLGPLGDDDPFIAIMIGSIFVWFVPDAVNVFKRYIEKDALENAQTHISETRMSWSPNRRWFLTVTFLLFLSVINIWSVSEFIYYNF